MTMLRPRGKALKIAREVVPGLDRTKNAKASSPSKRELPKDEVELKIVEINENRGKA